MIAIPRTASMVIVPVTSFAGYATYVRSTASPAQAHPQYMKASGSTKADRSEWKKVNNGLGLVDVGRSCGGL